jgi:hypothetical protein
MDITTATAEERKRLYDHIAQEMNDDRFFTTKELALLPKIMAPDEWLYGFSSGFMDGSTWLIVLTSKRVLFLNKNLMWGHEETSIGLGKINSVQKKTGIMFGSIMLHDGSREYSISNVWKKSVIPFTNRLSRAIEEFERSLRTGTPIPAPVYGPPPAPASQPTPPEAAPQPAAAPPPEPDTSVAYPPEPVSGPLRAYLDSVSEPARSAPPAAAPAPAPVHAPAPAVRQDDPLALRARLDRLRAAGAISDDDHAREMRSLGR